MSAALASASEADLAQLLSQAETLHSGIGGNSALLTVDGTPVFVKKIPLTDLEREVEHFMATSNLFKLPTFFQYGVGSAGFGAWRELVAHKMTTDWVLSDQCPNFPLMYYWCVLPTNQAAPMNEEELAALNAAVKYWAGDRGVRQRLEAIHNASANLVLFLEYVPQNLYQWLAEQLKAGDSAAQRATAFVQENIQATITFISSRSFLHFDAHFQNLLTDGEIVYFSDFGLALSSAFDLTLTERAFLETHRNYDRCSSIVYLFHCLITNWIVNEGGAGEDKWQTGLRRYLNGEAGELTQLAHWDAATVQQYAAIALLMSEFYDNLQQATDSTPYPAVELERLLTAIDR